jgi:AraC-like DNA-binding protein
VDPRLARRPIAEVAARHGCRSASHFTRTFAARYGVTPRAFRAEALEGSRQGR